MANSPQGSLTSRYQFIPRVLVFLTRGDEVLLIKRSADRPIFPNLYNGLGGHVERGESIIAAAKREVEEESGLRVNNLWLCATVAIDTNNAGAGIAMFVFRGEANEAGSNLKESDEGTLQWVPLSHIPGLPMVEDIPTLLPKVMELNEGDAPLWGLYIYDSVGRLEINFEA